ncbi:MAG: cysteine--tRNA ligase [Candidatus Paceibacterota bacterium]
MFTVFTENKNNVSPPIFLLNSETQKKELFESLKKGVVRMYACGPTVYDHIHIGNLRSYLVPDLLHRLFLYCGYTVQLTINVTDFGHLTDDGDAGEDKIMKGMQKKGYAVTLQNMRIFTEPYIESFKHDLLSFGNLPPTQLTRASDFVTQQIKLIETLVEKEYAYETSDGVYFDIKRFPRYGAIGNIDVTALKSGARIETNPEKRNPADFALWKKGDLGWESKWGLGFPGWHIECTAMAFATLGKQLDIHTGGEDLMHTHHNGELAQAEAITGKQFVRYWLHNAHITVNSTKISKSEGNGIRLADIIAKGFSPADYRYWLLTSHYRTPSNFSFEALTSAQQALLRLKRFVYEEHADVRATTVNETYEIKFLEAISDDLDTPKAVAILWELIKDTNTPVASKLATIHSFDSLLSLGLSKSVQEGQEELGLISITEVPTEVQELLTAREKARANKNWNEADTLRDKISEHGYQLEDTDTGPRITHR